MAQKADFAAHLTDSNEDVDEHPPLSDADQALLMLLSDRLTIGLEARLIPSSDRGPEAKITVQLFVCGRVIASASDMLALDASADSLAAR